MVQFSKKMIEKVFEIRRSSPAELRSKIKLSSDTLFEDLEQYYWSQDDALIRARIEDLFSLAGKELKASSQISEQSVGERLNVEKGAEIANSSDFEKPKLRKIIYRGQVTYVA